MCEVTFKALLPLQNRIIIFCCCSLHVSWGPEPGCCLWQGSRKKHEHVSMPYSWILQGMAHPFGGHEPPQLGQIKHLWGLHPWGENMVFYYINVKRATACWNVLLPCGLFYTDFNYAPSSFESLISAWFSWSHIACPAVCRHVCGEISETSLRQQILNYTRSISHLYQFSARIKTNSLFCSFRSWDILTNTA